MMIRYSLENITPNQPSDGSLILAEGTEILLYQQPLIASQSSKMEKFIKEPQTAVWPSFGFISVHLLGLWSPSRDLAGLV